jgi:hypothetical protein
MILHLLNQDQYQDQEQDEGNVQWPTDCNLFAPPGFTTLAG